MEWLDKLLGRTPPHIPDELWERCLAQLHFLHRLTPAKRTQLKSVSEAFLAKVPMRGAGGFELIDEVAVLVAAQASLLVLELSLDLYDDLSAVIIYPSAFIVRQRQRDAAGVVHEWREALAGEAIQAGGAVVLSWDDVSDNQAPHSTRNVVIHEFAHKIDMARGNANGFPPFLAGFHEGLTAATWERVFSTSYRDFGYRVQHPHAWPILVGSPEEEDAFQRRALPLDSYAAKNPAEFFAVSSESFFVAPEPMAMIYPDVYQLLAKYYRQQTVAAA